MPNEPPTSLVSTRTCVGRNAKMLGEQVLHHVRRLRALIDGHALLAFDSSRRRSRAARWSRRCGGRNGTSSRPPRRLRRRPCRLRRRRACARKQRLSPSDSDGSPAFRHRARSPASVTGGKLLVTHLDQLAGVLGLGARAAPRRRKPLRPASTRARPRSASAAPISVPLRCVSTPTQGVMTLASSAPVTTAITPGDFFAASVVDR